MKEYSPKRRTALLFTGSGTTGAYHAGVLRALDESGVKIDLVVGSGIGVVSAAFAAVTGGPRLYGPGGFWTGVRFGALYRLRPVVRLGLVFLGASFAIFAAPMALGLALGIVTTLLLIVDRVVPGSASRALALLRVAPEALSGPYLAALAIPVFALAVLAVTVVATLWLRDRRRFAEAFESFYDARPGLRRLQGALWQVAGGAAARTPAPAEDELGRRYVAMLAENLGTPGFRELVLRTADLDRGRPLVFVLLRDPGRDGALADSVDLRTAGQDALFFDALATGLLCPIAMPFRRISFPRGAVHAGETHRLTDATFVPGCGIAEALTAGAEQLIVVTGVPEAPSPSARRRGPLARLDVLARVLETQAAREIEELEGRVRGVDLWVIRPERRALGPMELDGARDPATEVRQTPEDLVELGFRDAYRQFVEPVVGQSPLPERQEGTYRNTQPVEL